MQLYYFLCSWHSLEQLPVSSRTRLNYFVLPAFKPGMPPYLLMLGKPWICYYFDLFTLPANSREEEILKRKEKTFKKAPTKSQPAKIFCFLQRLLGKMHSIQR